MEFNLKFIQKFGNAFSGHIVLPQTHSCNEIVYYDSDCGGIITINDTDYRFSSGDIAFISKNTLHSERHIHNFKNKGNLIYFGFDTKNYEAPHLNGVYSEMWDAKLIFNNIVRETINQEYGYTKIISFEIQKLLTILERKKFSNSSSDSTKTLTYVKNYIDEYYSRDISITSLAKNTGYSYGHFRRLFTQHYNTSPQSYLINVRCEKARELLISTNISCTDIAYQCGFSDSGQMSKMFKMKYNKTPLKIRKNENKKES